jgi:hypothetical protein
MDRKAREKTGKDDDDDTDDDDTGDDKDGKNGKDGKTTDTDEKQLKREQKLRLRELNSYAKEVLSDLEKTEFIREMVLPAIKPDMDESDIDDLIERSGEVRARIRKDTIKELRERGWKSPTDLGGDDDDEDSEPTSGRRRERSGPRSRDARSGSRMSKQRRDALRDRFGYGAQGRAAA